MERLEQVLKGQDGNYILPFLWMRGEENEIIQEEIEKIAECGIREICLESRPHPDFCGPGWWKNVDFILEEAKKRGMRVWVLDDSRFPTGSANGAYLNKYPELSKTYIAERHMDVIGPQKEAAVLIEPFLGEDGTLLSVLAIKKPESNTTAISLEEVLDLTDQVENGFVYFSIPEGRYRVFVLFTTHKNGGREHYMNLIDSRSVRVLLDEVYEPHFKRYEKEFGHTFAGFFSDEPELGNALGYDFHEMLGGKGKKLAWNTRFPWSEELEEELKKKWGEKFFSYLPALWFEIGKETVSVRTEYMEAVTDLVYRCFSGQIKEWCNAHKVEYIGHVIEDDNAHSRLGCSIGHYFKEMKGQHMAGIDVVHFQIVPGFDDPVHQWLSWDTDGEFFHYGLAKLASSCAQIDKEKKGRSLCEIFGNYGWAFGVSGMKWLTNHMLIRGINHFVPHAFSMKFPDRDCPPHFYARGNNPEFPFFTELMQYMNRVCHLLSDKVPKVNAAVMYHGEAEWGGGERMLFQKPGRVLLENQLDYQVIPETILEEESTAIVDRKLIINKMSYACLILPYFEYVPDKVANFVEKAYKEKFPVFVVDALPTATTHGKELSEEFVECVHVVPLSELAKEVKMLGTEYQAEGYFPHLRFSCYEQGKTKVYFFFNEAVGTCYDFDLIFSKENKALLEYDALHNTSSMIYTQNGKFHLKLEPGEAKIFLPVSENLEEWVERFDLKAEGQKELVATKLLSSDLTVSLREVGEIEFTKGFILCSKDKLPNMNGPDRFPEFCGTYRYEGTFSMSQEELKGTLMLYFGAFGDCAKIFLNGICVGSLLSCPGRIEITSFVKEGENSFAVEVTNTPVWKVKDPVSTHLQLAPTGLLEYPVLEWYQERKEE